MKLAARAEPAKANHTQSSTLAAPSHPLRPSRLSGAIHNQDNDKIGKRAIAAILDDYDEKIFTLLGMIDEAENLEIKPEKTSKKLRHRKKR